MQRINNPKPYPKGATYQILSLMNIAPMLNVKHDWSLFEHECDALGKVDGIYLLRKSIGAMKPLLEMVS